MFVLPHSCIHSIMAQSYFSNYEVCRKLFQQHKSWSRYPAHPRKNWWVAKKSFLRRNEEKVKEWLEHKRSEKKKKHQEELHLQQREHEENLKALQAMRKQMDDVLARAKNRSPRQRRGANSDENTSANRGKSKRKPRKNSPYAEVFGLNADGTTISIDHSQTNRIKMVGVIKSPPRIKRDTSFPPLGSSLDTSIGTSTESFDPSTVTPSPPSPIRVKPPSPSRYMLKK